MQRVLKRTRAGKEGATTRKTAILFLFYITPAPIGPESWQSHPRQSHHHPVSRSAGGRNIETTSITKVYILNKSPCRILFYFIWLQ